MAKTPPSRRRKTTRRAPVPGRRLTLHAAAELLRLERTPLSGPSPLDSNSLVPPLSLLESVNTSRLLPARYSDSVLTRLSDSKDDLEAIYALDNATNERLLAESNGRLGIAARELVFNVPNYRIINAAYAHPHPQGARFSTPYRGAWYAGFELPTAKTEVLFHRSVQFAEIGWKEVETLDYDQYTADFSGNFHDLRPGHTIPAPEALQRWTECLRPDSYVASQQLAEELLERGSLGLVYPSIRRPGGTCLACFRPQAVLHVRKRDLHRLTWYPDRPATFVRIDRDEPMPSPPRRLRAVRAATPDES